MKKNIIIHPLLFSILPILAFFENNQDIASLHYLTKPILISILSIIMFFYLINFFINNSIKSGLISSITIISFFFFANFSQLFSWIDIIIPSEKLYYQNIATICYLIILTSLIVLIYKSKKSFQKLNIILNLFSVMVVCLQIFNIINYQIVSSSTKIILKPTPDNSDSLEKKPVDNWPDVYYIILDGYGRHDIYQNLYNYDNSTFINYLKSKNFYIAEKSTTNYNKTLLSIPSTLNMNYIAELKKESGIKISDRKFFRNIIKENLFSYILDQNGYTFVTLPYTWFGNYENLQSDIHIKAQHEQNDFNALLISQTPLYALAAPLEMRAFQAKTMEILEAIPEISKIPASTFSYIHLMASHPPFIFDENGPIDKVNSQCLSGGDGNDYYETCPGVEEFRQSLVKQVEYFNNRLTDVINQILANSKITPIIIIQGDHGPGSSFHQSSLKQSNIQERMFILNAYLVPDNIKNELYPEISPVNSFRIIADELFGYNLGKLEDKNYFVIDGIGEKTIDITSQIKSLNK